MNKYVRKLLGVMFQSQQTQQVVQTPLQHSPTSSEEWHAHWQAKGFPWRTEPEIDAKRQEELRRCRAILPDIEKRIYPFKGMKLNRADIEWLLATHENGRGPVNWSDEKDRQREGLDLRGTDLRHVDLSQLPLARIRGGLDVGYWNRETYTSSKMRALQLEEARLIGIHLEGAYLIKAHLEGAILGRAHLEGANLTGAHLEKAYLTKAHLEGAELLGVYLEET